MQARAPRGWRVTVVGSTAVTAANGTSQSSDETLAAAADAEVYVGYGITPPVLAAAPNLKWAHSASAGIGGSLTDALRERVQRGLQFTNSAGAYGEAMAETVLAGVLYFVRSLDVVVRQQAEPVWNQHVIAHGPLEAHELSEHRVLVVGAGGIGSCVGRLFTALGCVPVLGFLELGHRAVGHAQVGDEFMALSGPQQQPAQAVQWRRDGSIAGAFFFETRKRVVQAA